MNKEIVDWLAERANTKSWFIRFFAMLEQSGVDEETITKSFELMKRPDSRYVFPSRVPAITMMKKSDLKAIDNFYAYCQQLQRDNGPKWFKEFLETTVKNIAEGFDRHKAEKHTSPTNIFFLFMRELVKLHPENVELICKGSLENGRIEIEFAGIHIGHIDYSEMDNGNVHAITMDDVRTMPGLERLGLGSHMIYELCRQVSIQKPDCAVIAWNVMKGADGEKAYAGWGGYRIARGEITDTPMTDEEYDALPLQRCNNHFYFAPDVVAKLGQKRSKIYGLANQNTSGNNIS